MMKNGFTHRSSGLPGLDSILKGGFVSGRTYLVIGSPGTGKTGLGTQFLRAGLDRDETVLCIHGEESKEDLLLNAAELGIDLEAAEFLDIGPESNFFTQSQSYDVVDPRAIEDDELIDDVRDAIEDRDPDRVLIDPITQFQYIEPTEYQFRKRIISFMRFLKDHGVTVLVTKTPGSPMDEQLKSLSDGVISLEYNDGGRRISVPKHRGVGHQEGTHGMEIRSGGIEIYPALIPEDPTQSFEPTQFRTNIDGLDSLLGGGLERGTVTIISGPSGVGKTTLATEFLQTGAANGDTTLAYLFEESIDTFSYRSESFGIPVTQLCDQGTLSIQTIEPLTQSPEEFAHLVKTQVEDENAELVVIDGIEGYKTAIKGGEGEIDLRRKLHALTRYLKSANISVILVDERSEVMGLPQPTSANVSYLADNIVFQNYIEIDGELQRVVGVLKKRIGGFETAPRQFRITADGLEVGDPLTDLHGVLEGIPERKEGEATHSSH